MNWQLFDGCLNPLWYWYCGTGTVLVLVLFTGTGTGTVVATLVDGSQKCIKSVIFFFLFNGFSK